MSVARPGPPTSSPTWTAIRGHEILWRHWDEGEYVVYHTGSGDTHLLNTAGAAVLAALERRALTLDALVRQVAGDLGCEPDDAFRDQVGRLVEAFDEVGLVEPTA